MSADQSNVISLDRHRLSGVVSQVVELRTKLAFDPCQFWALIDTLPVAVLVATDRHCSNIEGNVAARMLLRCPPGQNLSRSAPERELPSFEVYVEGKQLQAHELPMQKATATGKPAPRSECELRFPDGARAVIVGHSVPVFDGDGQVCGSIGAFVDITHERSLEEENRRLSGELGLKAKREALLLDLARLTIAEGEGKATLTRRVFELVGPHLDADLCFDYRFDPVHGRLSLISGPGVPRRLMPDFETIGLGEAFCGTVALTGRLLVADAAVIANDPCAAMLREAGVRAYACHPLKDSSGCLLGTLAFASTCRESFTSDEIGFLQTLCQYVALSWEGYRVRGALSARTQQLEALLKNAPLGIAFFDRQHRYVEINEELSAINGIAAADHIDRAIEDLLPVNAATVGPLIDKVFASGQTIGDFEVKGETPRQPGVPRYWLTSLYPVFNERGEVALVGALVTEITERKRTEEALRLSEARFRLAQEASRVGVFDWDAVTGESAWTPELEDIFGIERGSFERSYEGWKKRVHPEDLPRLETLYADWFASGREEEEWEYRCIRHGEVRWIAARGRVFRDDAGRPFRVVGTNQDITERREAEEALKKSEERFRRTFENAAVGVAHVGVDGKWLRVNKRLCQIVGYTPDELLQLTFQDITHPDDLDPDLSLLRRMLAGEIDHYKMDKRYRRADGSTVWVRLTVGCSRKGNGFVDYLISVIEDISDQKEAEFALRQSEERFRGMTNAIPQLVWTCTPDGLCNYVNEQWLTYTGAKPEDHYGQGWIELIHPEDRNPLRIAWTAALARKTAFDVEARLRAVDGSYRWFKKRAHPLCDETGAVVQWFGSSTDIQAIVEAREVLARSRVDLERLVEERTRDLKATQERLAHTQRMDALGQLAGGIAHDFNNVLQAIQGGLGLIRRRVDDPGSIKNLSDLMLKSTERGAAITRRLLAFSRQANLHAETVDAVQVLDEIREILLHSLGAGVKVKVAAPDGLPSVVADRGQLETVLVNLATNARDAMNGIGDITLAVAAETYQEDRELSHSATLKAGCYIRFSVSDSGSGMTPDVLAKVTEPFFTTKGPGRGTGLGLAMARGFAEQSQGGLQIESRVGHGTTVSLWLPAAERKSEAKDARPAAQSAGRQARILLVDDEPLVLQTLSGHLETAGHEVLPFLDAAEALVSLDGGTQVDLIITDLSMPSMDGMAFLLEAQKRLPKTPTLILTGFASLAASFERGAFEQAFHIVRKPVAEEELLAVIARALEASAPIPAERSGSRNLKDRTLGASGRPPRLPPANIGRSSAFPSLTSP